MHNSGESRREIAESYFDVIAPQLFETRAVLTCAD
jgi:hypothetical protein